MHLISALLLAIALDSCSTTVTRVNVPPDASQDAPPTITLTAIAQVPSGPGAPGDIELDKTHVSVTDTVHVSRGAGYQLLGNAVNPGGVQSFSLLIAQNGGTLWEAHATGTKDAAGTALNTLLLNKPDSDPNGTLSVTVAEPITVTATAENFNHQSTHIVVTYVPTDLTVSLAANPSTIGYQAPSQATLSWSVLYGEGPLTISGNVAQGTLQSIGTATVNPRETTTYRMTASDSKTTRSATATVSVRQPPPPPDAKLSARPNDGYNCLGVTDQLTWSVSNCGSGCAVTLTGKGEGYAANYNLNLPNLPASGSYSISPGDTTRFKLVATSAFGSSQATQDLTIAPPNVCNGAAAPTLSPFYFAVKASNPLVIQCTWVAVLYDTEDHARQQLQQTYGSGYEVTSINEDDYNHQRGCP